MPEEIERKFLIAEDNIDYSTKDLFKIYDSINALRKDVTENNSYKNKNLAR